MRIGIGASKRTIAGKKKDAGRSGIGIGITGIAPSSFIAGRRISNFLLSEIVLSATVMTGMTGLIGTIVIMIGNLMGRLGGEHPFMIGWGVGSACMTGLEVVLSIFLGARCNIPDVTVTKNGSCHHEHCKAYLLSTLVCINLKQIYFDCLSLGR